MKVEALRPILALLPGGVVEMQPGQVMEMDGEGAAILLRWGWVRVVGGESAPAPAEVAEQRMAKPERRRR